MQKKLKFGFIISTKHSCFEIEKSSLTSLKITKVTHWAEIIGPDHD